MVKNLVEIVTGRMNEEYVKSPLNMVEPVSVEELKNEYVYEIAGAAISIKEEIVTIYSVNNGTLYKECSMSEYQFKNIDEAREILTDRMSFIYKKGDNLKTAPRMSFRQLADKFARLDRSLDAVTTVDALLSCC